MGPALRRQRGIWEVGKTAAKAVSVRSEKSGIEARRRVHHVARGSGMVSETAVIIGIGVLLGILSVLI